MVEKTINSSECSECGKSLKVHPNSPILSIYKPSSNGPTIMQPQGSQCSYVCYTSAVAKRYELVQKMGKVKIILKANYTRHRKG